MRMRRTKSTPRYLAAGFAALASLSLIAACGGDDDGDSVSSDTADTAAPPTVPESPVTVPLGTTAPDDGGTGGTGGDAGFEHPTGAEDVIIEIGYEGGFVPMGTDFVNAPVLMITGDGTTIVSGPQILIYPGPLLPNFVQSRLDEAQIQELLARADELGLLADVEYPGNDMIIDASETVVRISVGGETFEHRAYALGLDDSETTPPGSTTADGEAGAEARANLQTFVEEATAKASEIGAASSASYESDAFLIQARPATAEELGSDVEPTITPWPADASVRLADAAECAEVPWDEVAELFADATQITLFDDGGTTYQLFAVPRLPGRSCG
jgi:hypothetical protein